MIEYETHPIANKCSRKTDPDEIIELVKSMVYGGGFDKDYPIVIYGRKVIDGRTRLLICKLLEIEPVVRIFTGSAAEAEAECKRLNKHKEGE